MDEEQAELIETFLAGLSEEYEGLNDAEAGEIFNVPYLLDSALTLFEERNLQNCSEDIQAYLSRGKLDEAKTRIGSYQPLTLSIGPGKGFTAKELMDMETSEIKWVIEGVIPEGLTLFAGKPKVGKSFFLLDAGLAIATGSEAFGAVPTEPADVLYLALEDPITRIKDRLSKMLGKLSASERLHIYPMGEWPRAHEGGIDRLNRWMEDHPETRLVIIDTLERFKRPQKAPGYHYSQDYGNLAPIHEFANRHNIGVVVVHHTKKTSTKDPFDEITGTTGLTAVADTLAKLDRTSTGRDGRVFAFRGRDVGEEELPFQFDNFRYGLVEDEAELYQGSESRQKIIRYLCRADEPVDRKKLIEVMEAWGVGKGIDTLLQKMRKAGDVLKVGYGKYAHGKHDDSDLTWRAELNQRIKKRLNRRRA
jgi:RecA-family ATPase